MRERVIEKFLRDGVRRQGGYAYKFTSPGNVGVPDRLVLWPDGRAVFVELKAEGGKLSRMQEIQINRIRKLGHHVAVVRGIEEAKMFLATWGEKRGDAV